MSEESKNNLRSVPINSLDYNMQMIQSKWGKDESLPKNLREKLKSYSFVYDENGEKMKDSKGEAVISVSDLWSLLGNYTEDLRLGNLDNKTDIPYCEHYLNLAGDLLKENFFKPFIFALSRVASRIELSQSKNGFLRRRPNSIESTKTDINVEPKRNSVFNRKL